MILSSVQELLGTFKSIKRSYCCSPDNYAVGPKIHSHHIPPPICCITGLLCCSTRNTKVMCAQDCKDCADLWRRRRSCINYQKLCASSETTHTFAPQRASDTTYRGPAGRISCTAYLCWACAACNVDHLGNQRTCFPVGPATEFDGLMLASPRTACPRICCAGVATRPPCFATQLVGRVNKPVPFKPSVLSLIAHQAKPARTTAPRLAAHPLSGQVLSFAKHSSTEQDSSTQMEGSGQSPVLKVKRGQ